MLSCVQVDGGNKKVKVSAAIDREILVEPADRQIVVSYFFFVLVQCLPWIYLF